MKARILSGSFSPGARSTPDDTSTAGRARDAQRLGDVAGIEPARQHERHRQDRDFPAAASRTACRARPGRVASRGARRVEQQPVGDLRRRCGSATRSARVSIGSAFITGRPKRVRTATTRSGVSLPCSCSMSGLSASTMSSQRRVGGIDRERDLARRGPSPARRAPAPPRARDCAGVGGKNTKPTMSAPGIERGIERFGGVKAADFDQQCHDGRVLAPSPRRRKAEAARQGSGGGMVGRRVRRRLHHHAGLDRVDLARGACAPRRRARGRRAAIWPARSRLATPPMITPTISRMKISTNSGRRRRVSRAGGRERVERHRHHLPVRHREGDDDNRQRDDDDAGDDLAEHDASPKRDGRAEPGHDISTLAVP